MKLIIDIPDYEYKQIKEVYEKSDIVESTYSYIYHGKPLSEVKAEIKEKCDRIDDIARANIYQYAPHREIQDLLCEILESIDKAEGEDKE